MEEQIKKILKENLKVTTSTCKEYKEGRDGCMGYVALTTKTIVMFGNEKISETTTSNLINF